MIKFIATGKENIRRTMLGLGITRKNLEQIQRGFPIHINIEEMDRPVLSIHEILIFFGEDEDSIRKEFEDKGFITEETKINIEKKREPQ